MTAPFFSIIIPARNEAHYIGKLLSSLATQKEKDFEILVVDNYSHDKTSQIALSFNNQLDISVVESKARNVAQARNEGARKAHGKYLVFLDADVVIPSNFLKKLKQLIISNNMDFATTRGIADSNHWLDKLIPYIINYGMWLSAKLGFPLLGGECCIFKRDVFEKISGFDEKVVIAEDHELALRAQKQGFKGRFYLQPIHIVSYRRFKQEGRWQVYTKWARALWHLLTHGPVYKSFFDYQMGGDVYDKESKT